MKNIPLLLFDFFCLPITIIRLVLIYFFGSKYNIPELQFLDVMLHSNDLYFNQQNNITIDTIGTDVRFSINRSSCLDSTILNNYIKTPCIKKKSIDTEITNINAPIDNSTNIHNNSITLQSPHLLSKKEIKILQKMLPTLLTHISSIKNNIIDTENIDVDKIDQKLDEEINKNINFINLNNNNLFIIDEESDDDYCDDPLQTNSIINNELEKLDSHDTDPQKIEI